jgi:hypothetical protein
MSNTRPFKTKLENNVSSTAQLATPIRRVTHGNNPVIHIRKYMMNEEGHDLTTSNRKYTCSSVTVNKVIMAIVNKLK